MGDASAASREWFDDHLADAALPHLLIDPDVVDEVYLLLAHTRPTNSSIQSPPDPFALTSAQ
jgi:hypothetical protein